MTDTPNAVQYHADALDERGRELPDRIYGWEMPVLVDCKTLEEARDWARRIFAADDRVASVAIRESIQQYAGGYWRPGRSMERIERHQLPEPGTAAQPSLSHAEHRNDATAARSAGSPVPAAPPPAGQGFPRPCVGAGPAAPSAALPPRQLPDRQRSPRHR